MARSTWNRSFPNKDPEFGSQITNMPILDIAYYPSKRGPYNYSVDGLNSQGQLDNQKAGVE